MPTSRHERALRRAGYRAIAGVDEAGRGALFGPVFAAAVVLDPERPIRGLDDSKQLDPERREMLAARIRERARAWAVGAADAFEIDRWNILEASRLAMRRAVERHLPVPAIICSSTPSGSTFRLPQTPTDSWGCIVFLDRRGVHPGEGRAGPRRWRAWDHGVSGISDLRNNKGYGTPDHLAALRATRPHHAAPVQFRAGAELQPT